MALVVSFHSFYQLDANLGIVLGHSDDVNTLQAIQTIIHSVTAAKPLDDHLRHSFLACKYIYFKTLITFALMRAKARRIDNRPQGPY
jgi:hypothetical protein